MDQIFVGRQAIYDHALHLFGYELLYRHDELNIASFDDGHTASSHVIISTFLDMGLERVVGSNLAFINLTSDFLEGDVRLPVSPEQVVLEILDDDPATPRLIQSLQKLVEQGFTIAVRDRLLSEDNVALLALAHIIKIDTLHHSHGEIEALYLRLRNHPVKLLAEKIENEEMLRFCTSLGFDYYQGFHLHQPQVISGTPLPNNGKVIQLLKDKLQDPHVDLKELEQLITLDATLSYQLLRYINCASYRLRQQVDSIHQAIIVLGPSALSQWVKLLAMKSLNREQPFEQLVFGLMRARMCECLAVKYGNVAAEQAFTTGLLSVLEDLLQTPIDELLDELPLTIEVKLALLDQSGPLGKLLAQSKAIEEGEWETLDTTEGNDELLKNCYRDAVLWSDARLKIIDI